MELSKRAFRLEHNKIPYLIPGGPLIERFLGEEERRDTPKAKGKAPQSDPVSQIWMVSTVRCTLPGSPDSRSKIVPEDGGGYLAEQIQTDPDGFLGSGFYHTFGAEPGFLLKLLNSRDRLLVQAHPSKEQAQHYFHHPFGKTEAWYVLDTEGEAYIWAGFKPGVNKERFRALIERQDCDQILDCLHRFPIQKGDTVFVRAGLPHALGSGSLVAEIQEPTDITIRAERFRPDGSELPESFLHSGIGMDGLLDCFDFTTASWEETRNRIFLPAQRQEQDGGAVVDLIDVWKYRCFGTARIECRKRMERKNIQFTAGLVLSGAGELDCKNGCRIPLQKGTEFFIPHQVAEYAYETKEGLEVLECYPPLWQANTGQEAD